MPAKVFKALGKVKRTERGFEIVEFKDCYDHPCSLQQSSLAEYEKPGTSAIWLGPSDAKPQVLWHRAHELGIETGATCGWVAYPIPEDVLLTTRAHLNREQVKALIQHLKCWLRTGSFKL